MRPISPPRVPLHGCTLRFLVRGRRWLRSPRTRLAASPTSEPLIGDRIMKTSYLATLVTLSIALVTMTGCAGETDDSNEPNQSAESTDVRVNADTNQVAPSYTARITITDIKE